MSSGIRASLLLMVCVGVSALAVQPASEDQAGAGVFASLLRLVPNSEQARTFVYFNDVGRAADVLAQVDPTFSPPTETSDVRAVQDYVMLLITRLHLSAGPYLSGFDGYGLSYLTELKQRAGYDSRNVEATILAGSPPQELVAIQLDLPATQVRDHILQTPQESLPAPKPDEYAGVPILSWGEEGTLDFNRRTMAPGFDELGRGSRLGFLGSRLLYTLWVDTLKAMIDAALGNVPSLAQDEDYALLAASFDALHSYSALATTVTQTVDRVRQPLPEEAIRLKPYQLLGTSIGHDGSAFFMGVALVHDTAQDAAINVERLQLKLQREGSLVAQRPWSELFEVEVAEIVADGRLLQAKIPLKEGQASSIWTTLVFSGDPLLLRE